MEISKIYYNKFYEPYKCPCYLVYIEEVGVYIITDLETNIILDQLRFKLTSDNIDSYTHVRGFYKIADIDSNGNIIWYDQYRDDKNREKLIKRVSLSKSVIAQQYRLDMCKRSNLTKVYSIFNKITES